MITRKQLNWRLRNKFLFFFKGQAGLLPNISINAPLTVRERDIVTQIIELQQELLENSVESSRQLGYKAKYRDPLGRILEDDPRNQIQI